MNHHQNLVTLIKKISMSFEVLQLPLWSIIGCLNTIHIESSDETELTNLIEMCFFLLFLSNNCLNIFQFFCRNNN